MLDDIQRAFLGISIHSPPLPGPTMFSGHLCVGVNQLNCKIRARQIIMTFLLSCCCCCS